MKAADRSGWPGSVRMSKNSAAWASPSPKKKASRKEARGSGLSMAATPPATMAGNCSVTFGGQQRDMGQFQDFEDIKIIGFKGKGEGYGGEVGEGPLGLEREQGRLRALVFLKQGVIRQKNPFTGEIGMGIEKVIDGLKTEIAHAHVIFVGVDQGHRTAVAPFAHHRAVLAGQQVLEVGNDLSGHEGEIVFITPHPDPLPSRGEGKKGKGERVSLKRETLEAARPCGCFAARRIVDVAKRELAGN